MRIRCQRKKKPDCSSIFSTGCPDTVKPLGETTLLFESARLSGNLAVAQPARHADEHECGIGGDFRVSGRSGRHWRRWTIHADHRVHLVHHAVLLPTAPPHPCFPLIPHSHLFFPNKSPIFFPHYLQQLFKSDGGKLVIVDMCINFDDGDVGPQLLFQFL